MKILPEIADAKKSSILVIAHLRKPIKGKIGQIPTIDDVSGSASFKQDATDVWIVHKNPVEDDFTHTTYQNSGYLIVAKSKSGFSGPIKLLFGYMKAGIREPGEFD
jgi:replicative DNA helicase